MRYMLIILNLLILSGCITPRKNPYNDPGYINSKLQEISKNDLAKKNEYINTHPNLSQEIKDAILSYNVIIGMAQDDVIATWGNPVNVTRNTSPLGIFDVWYYDIPAENFAYTRHFCLSFQNGKLINFIENR